MRLVGLITLVAVVACGGGEERADDVTVGVDPRLGHLVARSPSSLRISAAAGGAANDELLVVYEEAGVGWHAATIAVAADAHVVLPSPALGVGDTVSAVRWSAPHRGALLQFGASATVLWVLGQEWVAWPPLPVADDADGFGAAVEADHAFVDLGGRVFFSRGEAWSEPVTSSGGAVLIAGGGAGRRWLVSTDAGRLAATPIDTTTGAAGATVLGPTAGTPSPSANNGNAEQFQLTAGGSGVVFDGRPGSESFSLVDTVALGLAPMPGAFRTVGAAGDGSWHFVENGTRLPRAMGPLDPIVDCAGTCAEHEVVLVLERPLAAAESMMLVIVDRVGADTVLGVRRLALPVLEDPFQ